ncbi:hypothetical protein C0W54_09615 [Photobacterium kishitanii]|uniref:spondin domain-containing protein n=1 Tax=Photobacterium kishitanii TaxID=318456 RepID=UPI000D1702F3|nr:spondin domain-containing protein [Photobacterium kishitanii]PSW62081.1 hypothetical protein C0W54_09615 [Photobacterium kishitanii]
MKKTILAIILSSTLFGCNDNKADVSNSETATYELTLNSNWSANNFSTNFPSNRHFSGVIGLTHNTNGGIFELGKLASAGIVEVAETGAKTVLTTEINDLQNLGKSLSTIDGSGITVDQQSVTVTFDISQDYPYISLVSMLAPSPDWFTGLNSYQLFVDGKWVESVDVSLNTYDAGSDGGLIFTSANDPITPPDVITLLTSDRANTDFEKGLHYLNSLPVTTITIKRLN